MRDASSSERRIPGRVSRADHPAGVRGDADPRTGQRDSDPGGPHGGVAIAEPPLLVPVLRAGLGMAEAAFNLLPESQMGFVGLARDEHTHEPTPYMAALPDSLTGRTVIVLDPMLATGGSLLHCLQLLAAARSRPTTVVCALAAPEGIRRIEDSGLAARFHRELDEPLNDKAYIVPGPRRRRRSAVRTAVADRGSGAEQIHHPSVPAPPLNGPTTSEVIQPA